MIMSTISYNFPYILAICHQVREALEEAGALLGSTAPKWWCLPLPRCTPICADTWYDTDTFGPILTERGGHVCLCLPSRASLVQEAYSVRFSYLLALLIS
jgi:hypothetical protein